MAKRIYRNRGVTRHLRGHLIRPGLLLGEGGGRPQDDPRGSFLDPSVKDERNQGFLVSQS